MQDQGVAFDTKLKCYTHIDKIGGKAPLRVSLSFPSFKQRNRGNFSLA